MVRHTLPGKTFMLMEVGVWRKKIVDKERSIHTVFNYSLNAPFMLAKHWKTLKSDNLKEFNNRKKF